MKRIFSEFAAYLEALITSLPGASGSRLRGFFLSRRLGALGAGSSIGMGCRFKATENIYLGRFVSCGTGGFFAATDGRIEIGDRVAFNTNVHINAEVGGRISIGNDCLIGPNVVLRTANHRFERSDIPIREQGHILGDLFIDDDVWLGANVVVIGGVRIGRGVVVAAGAVVTRDVPPMVVVGGCQRRLSRRAHYRAQFHDALPSLWRYGWVYSRTLPP